MQFVECSYEQHGAKILEIFNDAIVNSTALYEYEPRSLAKVESWFAAKHAGAYPVIGAVSGAGELVGFASYGVFRAWPAYKYTVEHSVYVDGGARAQGVGTALMRRLIERARAQDYHVLVGGIDLANTASIRMHEKLGFTFAGTVRQAGYKFGRWLDLAFYQLVLETPAEPRDG